MRKLRRQSPMQKGGRAAVVVPNGTLFADGVAARIKKQLVEEFNLHTVVRLGDGVFAPYTDIPSNLLFFEHGKATEKVWFYELPTPEGRKKYSKTKPIQHHEFEPLKTWWNDRKANEYAWCVPINDIVNTDDKGKLSVNLDLKNPNKKGEYEYQAPEVLIQSIVTKEKHILKLMEDIQETINIKELVV